MNTALPAPTTRRRVSVAREMQSYKNIGYLLCSFFLGLFYFVLLRARYLPGDRNADHLAGCANALRGHVALVAICGSWARLYGDKLAGCVHCSYGYCSPEVRRLVATFSGAFKQFYDLEDTGVLVSEVSARYLFI